MAEADPNDKSIMSFTVRHHRFDAETNHFRWFDLKTFDTEAEMVQLMNEIFEDIERRRLIGQASPKEQVAGSHNEPIPVLKTQSGSAYSEIQLLSVDKFIQTFKI